MADSDLQLTFGADASGVVQGVAQAKSAIGDFAPQVDALAKSFGGLAGQVKSGFQGVEGLAGGLQKATAGGAAGLAGLAEAGGGAVAVVTAVVGAALSATAAMADWATSTLKSSTASAEAKQNAANLNNAFGQAQSSFKNAGDTLANALAPALTQLVGGIANVVQKAVDFYNGSTVLKTGLDWLIAGLKATVVPTMALAEAFVQGWILIKGAWSELRANWTLVQDEFTAGCDAIKASFKSMALAVGDAISGNWGRAAQQAMQGVGQAAQAASPHVAKIRADLAAIDALTLATAREALSHLSGAGHDIAGVFRPPPPSPVPSARGGGGSGGAPVGGGASDQMEQYRAGLTQLEDQTRASTQAWLADLSAIDLKYWQGILDHAKLSLKEREEITHTVAELTAKINGEGQSQQLQQDKERIDADKGNLAALKADWQKYVDDTVAAYGAGTKAVIGAQREMADALKAEQQRDDQEMVDEIVKTIDKEVEAHRQATRQVQQLAEQQAARAWKEANSEVLQAENQFVSDALKGRLNLSQMLEQIALRTATKEIAADLRYFTERALLEAETGNTSAAKEEGGLLIHLMTEQRKTAGTATGAAQRAAAENTGFFAQVIAKLASLLGIHIGTEASKTGATAAGAAARTTAEGAATIAQLTSDKIKVASAAGVAGAEGTASFAGAPWPIDMGAPAFGATVAQAAAAFAAAGGYDIPAGVNPITQLHAQEMVLPARLANPMRDMLASFDSGGAPAAGGHSFSFGDTHIHGEPNMSPTDFKQALAEHRANVAEAVASALHGGWRPSYRQPVGAL